METKTCAFCGETKPVELYRKYYNRNGEYTYCSSCEKIETRRKNLMRKKAPTSADLAELDKINKLYDIREAAGLKRFGKRHKGNAMDLVNEQLEKFKDR